MLAAAPAGAHPLGNFTVNRYHGLTDHSFDGIADAAVVDHAEIPTVQLEDDVDTDGDGEVTDAERERLRASSDAQHSPTI